MNFYDRLDSDLRHNPKRFWSIFKRKTKSSSVPAVITLGSADINPPSRTASTPDEIAELFNAHFASVIQLQCFCGAYSDHSPMPTGPFLTEITLTVLTRYSRLFKH